MLVIAIMAGLVLLSRILGDLAVALRLVAVVMPLFYFVVAEAYYQATPGKRLFGLAVVTVDGKRPDTLAHVVRGLTRVPEAMVLIPYLLVVPFSEHKQRFGDMVTETLVVRRDASRRA